MCQKKVNVGTCFLKLVTILLNGLLPMTVGLISVNSSYDEERAFPCAVANIFFAVNLTCPILSLVSLIVGILVDMRGCDLDHTSWKYTDVYYHLVASIVVIVTGILMITSAWEFVVMNGPGFMVMNPDMTSKSLELHIGKTIIGVVGVINGIAYLVTAGNILLSVLGPTKPKVLQSGVSLESI